MSLGLRRYRFAAKLRTYADLLDACIARVLERLHRENPDMGRDVAIDASDLPAYANGQRFVGKGGRERTTDEYSDHDASWGHRSAVSTRKGGGFYCYRVHAAVCVRTGLPVSWEVASARANESTFAAPLIDATKAHGFAPSTVAMDKGYDIERVYGECEDRGCRPIIPLRETPAVKDGKAGPPTCEHGEWAFAGSDPSQGIEPALPDRRVQAREPVDQGDRVHPLVPRESKRWKALHRGRASVEREFGRLKNEWALLPFRVRGIERVRLHTDLAVPAKLATALMRQRPLVT